MQKNYTKEQAKNEIAKLVERFDSDPANLNISEDETKIRFINPFFDALG